jgi:hypothetical protein
MELIILSRVNALAYCSILSHQITCLAELKKYKLNTSGSSL